MLANIFKPYCTLHNTICDMYMYIVFDTEIYALVLLNIDLFAGKNEMKLKKMWKIGGVGVARGAEEALCTLAVIIWKSNIAVAAAAAAEASSSTTTEAEQQPHIFRQC